MHHLFGRRPLVLSFLASVLRPAVARDDSAARISAAVDSAIRPLIAAFDIPGMSVGITFNGTRHLFHYGVASRESGSPVTAETLFEIGSLSKTFTATAATYAHALGKLSLSDSPGRTVPALRGAPIDRASLLHLGTYTAGGLPLQFPDAIHDLDDAIAFFKTWKPAARPGQQRRYSNPSIGLLGHAVALAMQRDFADLVEAQLLPRLGLRQTHIRVPASRMQAYAWGYNEANEPIRVNPGVFGAQAYGVKSTAADMLQLLEANIDPSSLDPLMRQAVDETHVPRFQVGPMAQGLGWEQYPLPVSLDRLQAGNSSALLLDAHTTQAIAPTRARQGPRLFNKTGSTNGFGAYAAFVPAQRIGVVMLANRNVPIPARISAAHAVLQSVMSPR